MMSLRTVPAPSAPARLSRASQLGRSLVAYGTLIRWKTTALAALCATLAAYRVHTVSDSALGILAITLICGAGFALNDAADLPLDRINHPGRPIPAGRVSRWSATLVAGALLILGNLFALADGGVQFLITVSVTACLIVYSSWLKRFGPIGNLVTALMSAAIFVYFALPRHALGLVMPAAVMACTFIFARELLKDILDVSGDRIHGRMTLPLLTSLTHARWLAALCFGLTSLVSVASSSPNGQHLPNTIAFGTIAAAFAVATPLAVSRRKTINLVFLSRIGLAAGVIIWALT
jgi:geranylgeranylglycerol-phosphate geranylgeranyltransferase